MTSAERLCLIAARSEALLADFVILFLLRWAMKYLGVEYVYFQPVLDQASPPLALADLHHPASALLYGTMYFVSGLPELILAGMWFLYMLIGLSIFGQSLGMRQAGIRIVGPKGGKPGFFRVLIRQLIAPISAVCWIGYWPLAFTRDAAALHELASGTRLVYVEKSKAAVGSP